MSEDSADQRLHRLIMVARCFGGHDELLATAGSADASPLDRDNAIAILLFRFDRFGSVIEDIAKLRPDLAERAGGIGRFMSAPFFSPDDRKPNGEGAP